MELWYFEIMVKLLDSFLDCDKCGENFTSGMSNVCLHILNLTT